MTNEIKELKALWVQFGWYANAILGDAPQELDREYTNLLPDSYRKLTQEENAKMLSIAMRADKYVRNKRYTEGFAIMLKKITEGGG